jgi:hypothetical protein
MSFIKRWDVANIATQINTAAYECSSPYNDGFVGWGVKQDLYRIKWILEDAINRCPHYAPEDEWLREHEKKKVIKILSNDIQQN